MTVAPKRWKQMENGKKQMISRYIVKVEFTGVADKLKEQEERGVHNDLEESSLIKRVNSFHSLGQTDKDNYIYYLPCSGDWSGYQDPETQR